MLLRINSALLKDSSEGFLLEVLNSFHPLEQTHLISREFWIDWGKNPLLNVKMHFSYNQGKLKTSKKNLAWKCWTQDGLYQESAPNNEATTCKHTGNYSIWVKIWLI